MKLQQKIVLTSFIVALVGTFICILLFPSSRSSEYVFYFGTIAFWGGLLELIAGLFLLFLQDKRIAQGLLIGAGLLMVVGFVTCTGSFNVH